MVEDDGVDQEQHGQQEVGHDVGRRQFVQDRFPAEDDLCKDPGHQAQGQGQKVAPARPAPDGGEGHEHDGHRDQHIDQTVAELHPGVVLERRHDAGRSAGRPVAATKPRAGQANGSTAHNADGQRYDGKRGTALAEPRARGKGPASS